MLRPFHHHPYLSALALLTLMLLVPASAGAAPRLRLLVAAVGSEAAPRTITVEADDAPRVLQELRQDPGLAYAELDARRASTEDAPPPAGTPWSLAQLGWRPVIDGEGAGAPVAILDSGFAVDHPAFRDSAGRPRFSRVWNADTSTTDVADGSGHGTAVASIMGGATSPGAPSFGVAADAPMLGVRIADAAGRMHVSTEVDAIRWAVAQGARVINLSLGSNAPSAAEHAAIVEAMAAGVVVVAAAGNDGDRGPGAVDYPAAYPGVIAVASSDATGAIADYSSHGPEIDVSAPGVGVDVATRSGGWQRATGTSFAAPAVAGAAARVLGIRPDWTPQQVHDALVTTARDTGPPGRDDTSGAGIVDLTAALALAAASTPAPDTSAPPAPPVETPAAPLDQPVADPAPAATAPAPAGGPTPPATRDRYEPNAVTDALRGPVRWDLRQRATVTLRALLHARTDPVDAYAVRLPSRSATLRIRVAVGSRTNPPGLAVLRVTARGTAVSVPCRARAAGQLECGTRGLAKVIVRVTARSRIATSYTLRISR